MNRIEMMLQNALAPTEEDAPNPCLKQKIIQAYQEVPMNHKIIKRPAMAILAAAILIASGSLTAVAAWHYLNPAEVAEDMECPSLAKAFEGKDAISINEAQSYGDYKITLMGMVSGKKIAPYLPEAEGELHRSSTYIMLSIEKKDGTAMPSTKDDEYLKTPFLASPFLQGQPINQINLFAMHSSSITSTKDGIMYKLISCDNLEPFADREVYLGITNTEDLDYAAYEMDADTGRISRSQTYSGVNALFTLPLSQDQADAKKAEILLREWLGSSPDDNAENNADDNDPGQLPPEILRNPAHKIRQWPIKKIKKNGTCISCTKNLKPDKEGVIHFFYDHENCLEEGEAYANVRSIFKHKKTGTSEIVHCTGSDEIVHVQVATKEKDGSYTVRDYHIDL